MRGTAEVCRAPVGGVVFRKLRSAVRCRSGRARQRPYVEGRRNGKRHDKSSHNDKKEVARDLLRRREGPVADGVPMTTQMSRFRFEHAAADLLAEYRVNSRRSIDEAGRRLKLHVARISGEASITTSDVLSYIGIKARGWHHRRTRNRDGRAPRRCEQRRDQPRVDPAETDVHVRPLQHRVRGRSADSRTATERADVLACLRPECSVATLVRNNRACSAADVIARSITRTDG